MRRFWFIPFLCVFFLLGVVSTLSATAGGKTQVITDEKAHTVKVVIDGKEVLTIDAKGLHVNGSVQYTGTIRDIGQR